MFFSFPPADWCVKCNHILQNVLNFKLPDWMFLSAVLCETQIDSISEVIKDTIFRSEL